MKMVGINRKDMQTDCLVASAEKKCEECEGFLPPMKQNRKLLKVSQIETLSSEEQQTEKEKEKMFRVYIFAVERQKQ